MSLPIDQRRAPLIALLACFAVGWLVPFSEPSALRLASGLGVGCVLLAWFYLDWQGSTEERALQAWVAAKQSRPEDTTRSPRAAAVRWGIVTAIVLAFYALLPHPFAEIFWTLIFCGKKGPTTLRGESRWTRGGLIVLPTVCMTVLALTIYHAFAPGAVRAGEAAWWVYVVGGAGVVAATVVDLLACRWFPVIAIGEPPAVASAANTIRLARGNGAKHRPVSRKSARRRSVT